MFTKRNDHRADFEFLLLMLSHKSHPQTHILGCNNGGGGGNFSKVKLLVAKWIGARKRLFSDFLAPGWDFRNAGT